MINPRSVFQLAKKWQMVAALGRRRLTAVAGTKDGHCVVYTAEGARFEVPLGYLGTTLFSELLRMSEDEFGFAAGEGRITLPCDAAVMEYVMGMLRRKPSEEVERAVLSTVVMPLPCNRESSMAMAAPKGITQSVAIF